MDEDREKEMETTPQEGGAATPPPPPTGGEPSAEKPPNPFAALGGVIASPSKTFAGLGGANWVWLILPLLLMVLLSAAGQYLYISRVDMDTVVRREISHSRFASRMTDEQIQQSIDRAKKMNPLVRSVVFSPLAAIWLLIVALMYWLVFMAMGQSPKFLQSAQVVIWSQVPQMIKLGIICIVFGITNPTNLDPRNPIASNLGGIIGQAHLSGWLYKLLSNVDIFQFWMMALYIIGFSVVLKADKKRVAYVIIGIFLVKVLLTTAWGFFFMK